MYLGDESKLGDKSKVLPMEDNVSAIIYMEYS